MSFISNPSSYVEVAEPLSSIFGVCEYLVSFIELYLYVLVFIDSLLVNTPPLALYSSIMLPCQCAYNVMLLVGTYEVVTCVPPFTSVYQPKNVYSSLVGIGKFPISVPSYTDFVSGETDPPFGLKVTKYFGFSCHWA